MCVHVHVGTCAIYVCKELLEKIPYLGVQCLDEDEMSQLLKELQRVKSKRADEQALCVCVCARMCYMIAV